MNNTASDLKLKLGRLDVFNDGGIRLIEGIDYNLQNLLQEIVRAVRHSGENIRDIPIDYLADIIDLDSYIDSILNDYKDLEMRMRVLNMSLKELEEMVK